MPRMPSALITGISGQDGLYLAGLLPDVRLHNGDLTDLSSLIRAMRDSDPDEVYNLGAVSFVAYSWENAPLTTDVTGKGVLNMLEAVRLHSGDDLGRIRFYQARARRCSARCRRSRSARARCCGPVRPTA